MSSSRARVANRQCGQCGRRRAPRFFKGERGRVCIPCQKNRSRRASRGRRIEETYGITNEEYDILFAAQGGCCAICGGTRRQKLSIDHCHKTGRIRGLLCRNCNGRLLTAARDNIETLRNAISYLENNPATAVLGERTVPEGDER